MAKVRDITFSDGSVVPMRASALVPRLYRVHFGRDLVRDMSKLERSIKAATETGTDLDALDLTVFEDVAWIMARHADPSVPATPDEWLESLDFNLDIYEALPQMMELWSANLHTTSIPAKK